MQGITGEGVVVGFVDDGKCNTLTVTNCTTCTYGVL